MKSIPIVAFCVSIFSIIFYEIGLIWLVPIPALITIVLAVLGLFFNDKDHPVSGRIACVLAALLSVSPFFVPVVQSIRLGIMAKKRAAQTAPLYQRFESDFADLKPKIDAYFKQYSVMPDIIGRTTMLQAVDTSGALRTLPTMAGLEAPTDPFSPKGDPVRWATVRGEGVLLVSVGQDGAAEMPLPGVVIDRPPVDPLAAFAMLGVDPRLVIYDPTNGALGLGDVVKYHGKSPYGETFKRLIDAWDDAHRASAYRPTKRHRPNDPDPDPQSLRDAAGAERLMAEKKYLAALCLASRGVNERHPFEAQWKEGDYTVERTRAIALYHLGAYREAADALVNYTTARPNDVLGHFMLGAALYFGGNLEDARLHLAAAAQISSTDTVSNLAETCREQLQRGGQPPFPAPEALPQATGSAPPPRP